MIRQAKSFRHRLDPRELQARRGSPWKPAPVCSSRRAHRFFLCPQTVSLASFLMITLPTESEHAGQGGIRPLSQETEMSEAGMDGPRQFLESVRRHGWADKNLLGLLHVLIG